MPRHKNFHVNTGAGAEKIIYFLLKNGALPFRTIIHEAAEELKLEQFQRDSKSRKETKADNFKKQIELKLKKLIELHYIERAPTHLSNVAPPATPNSNGNTSSSYDNDFHNINTNNADDNLVSLGDRNTSGRYVTVFHYFE